jgi:ADP-ribose pyrophosphatase
MVQGEKSSREKMKEDLLKPWRVISEKEIFTAPPWIHLFRQTVELPDGRIVDDYHKIQLPDFVAIVAQTPDGKILVERQYKHGIGHVTLTVPAGAASPGEDALATAKRELMEETGYASDEWQWLGRFPANGSYGCGAMNLCVARNVRKVSEPKSGDLEEMEILLMSADELFAAIREGKMSALGSVTAIALAAHPKFTK